MSFLTPLAGGDLKKGDDSIRKTRQMAAALVAL